MSARVDFTINKNGAAEFHLLSVQLETISFILCILNIHCAVFSLLPVSSTFVRGV